MTVEPVLVHRDGAVTTISINRPEVRNAVDRAVRARPAVRPFETHVPWPGSVLSERSQPAVSGR